MSHHPAARLLQVTYADRRVARSHVFADFPALGVPDAQIQMHYNFWILETPDGHVVIDTGFAVPEAYWVADAQWRPVPETLDALGIHLRDVRQLVLTHYHFDHAGHVDLFPEATVFSSAREHAAWSEASAERLARSFVDPHHLEQVERAHREGRLRLLADEPARITEHVTAIPAPGHTPGQLAVLVETPSGTRLLTSDAVHFSAQLELGWSFFAHSDPEQAARSIRLLEDVRERTGAILVPGHEPRVREEFPPDPRAADVASVLG